MSTDSLPLGAVCYFRSHIFSAVPPGQRRQHVLRPDVWSRIRVLDGALRVVTLSHEQDDDVLHAGDVADVKPGIPHWLEPVGPRVSFVVRLYRSWSDTTRRDLSRWENEGGRVQD